MNNKINSYSGFSAAYFKRFWDLYLSRQFSLFSGSGAPWKSSRVLFFFLGLSFFATGCGKNYSGTTVEKERDRQREMAQVLKKDYDQVSGEFEKAPTDTSVFVSIALKLRVVSTLHGDMAVPQPVLLGDITFQEKKESKPYLFALSEGVYDAASGDLSAHVQCVNQSGCISLSCRYLEIKKKLDCDWSSPVSSFKFLLQKKI